MKRVDSSALIVISKEKCIEALRATIRGNSFSFIHFRRVNFAHNRSDFLSLSQHFQQPSSSFSLYFSSKPCVRRIPKNLSTDNDCRISAPTELPLLQDTTTQRCEKRSSCCMSRKWIASIVFWSISHLISLSNVRTHIPHAAFENAPVAFGFEGLNINAYVLTSVTSLPRFKTVCSLIRLPLLTYAHSRHVLLSMAKICTPAILHQCLIDI